MINRVNFYVCEYGHVRIPGLELFVRAYHTRALKTKAKFGHDLV